MLRIERRMDQYKSPDSEGWKTDDESNSCSDSLITGSSCCSSPTPKSSPKRSPLLVKRVSFHLHTTVYALFYVRYMTF